MDSLFLLVPLSLILLVAAVASFRWAVRSGQFRDLDHHGRDILFPDRNDNQDKGPGEPKP